MKIVQLVNSSAEQGIRREAERLNQLFTSRGHTASLVLTEAGGEAQVASIDPEALLLIHFDMSPVSAAVLEHPAEKTVVLLQDYVPEENFPEYSPGHREAFGESLQQLRRLVSSAELSVAHVNSGMDILTGLNARRVRKIPVYITADDFQETDDRFTLAMYPEGTRRILFAGEVDSASGVNDLYKTYWYFRRFVKEEKQDWQMLIAGDHRRCDSYNYTLKESIRRFELEQFWIVHNSGLEPDQLSALFARAEVFMTFDSGDLRGENIVRAIRQGLPVIAHSAAAGEDILGDSELLIHPLIHSAAAERLERLQRDEDWRRVVTEAQSERLENLEERAVSFLWTSALSRFA